MAHVNVDYILASMTPIDLSIEIGGVVYRTRKLSLHEVRKLCFGSITSDEAHKLIEDVVISDPKPPLAKWAAGEEPYIDAFIRVLSTHAEVQLQKKLNAVSAMVGAILTNPTTTANRSTAS